MSMGVELDKPAALEDMLLEEGTLLDYLLVVMDKDSFFI
jgi:hypothetical protein